ncbi:hypothetical protein [Nocardia sp. NPDC020380]|uniref:hypothetical protein n=1 Tax=Nocardia sp. NPDC020380 TaxID=3364309 RepID=UPI0037AD5ECF
MGETSEPFPGSWAIQSGLLTKRELRMDFERVFPDVYVPKGVRLDACGRAQALGHWAKGAGILSGFSAAALHGTKWLDDKPAEIVLDRRARPPAGVRVHRDTIDESDIHWRNGFRCTTPLRTAFDLGRRLEFAEAIEVLDALCNATALTPEEIARFADLHPGARACTALRTVLPHVDGGAESIPETRTRMLLRAAGFPTPETQIRIRHQGLILARLDMGWREWQVGVEYDGSHHWTDRNQHTRDIDRYAILPTLGWTLIRVSARHLTHAPHLILERVNSALTHRGWRSSGT